MSINTCLETTQAYHTIAYYSHIIPILIITVLIFYILKKSKFSKIANVFSAFIFTFSIWLLGDLIVWVSPNYNSVTFFWSFLDYVNISAYLMGAYFYSVLIKEKDISLLGKGVIFIAIIPAWLITIYNQSIVFFDQSTCEAINNTFLTTYKLVIEILSIIYIIFLSIFNLRGSNKLKRAQIVTISGALLSFFIIFSTTEYISSVTGIYELNLYSLFILPLFLLIIIYSIVNLKIFKFKNIGFQFLAYLLMIIVGSQFFILESTTDKTLSLVTLIITIGVSAILIRSGKKEAEALIKIENLAKDLGNANEKLRELDRQKDEVLGIIVHQLATPVSSIRWNLEMMMDGDLGKLTKDQKESVGSLQSIANNLIDLVNMILDVSRIQLGRMKVDQQELDLDIFFKEIIDIISLKAKEKKVKFLVSLPKKYPKAFIDRRYTHMTIENLLSNAIKYTPEKGVVNFIVDIKKNVMHCKVKDNGVGIPKKDQSKIFGKMFRASNVQNTIDGNGFGLYVAKGAIEAQGGKIWFESEEGKGTTFFIELPLVSGKAK